MLRVVVDTNVFVRGLLVKEGLPADPADERVLACAMDAGADLIVSGDHHLLDLDSYQDIPILTVRAFLGRLVEEELAESE